MSEKIGWEDGGELGRDSSARRAGRTLLREAAAATLAVAAGLAATIHVLGDHMAMDAAAAAASFAIYAAVMAVAVANLHTHRHSHFGAANVVTTIRAAITAMIGGVVLASGRFGAEASDGAVWVLAAAAVFALASDGLDGHLARRRGTASAFGARFDMEVDALLILFLSVAAFTLGKAGAWVLLIGSMRYGFFLAQAATEPLRGELSPSIRRKTVCVIQVATLCLLLLPVVGPPLSGALAGVALFLLIYSFGVDVIALLNAHRGGRRAT